MHQSKWINDSNSPINQFKGALMIEKAMITTILIFEIKNKLAI